MKVEYYRPSNAVEFIERPIPETPQNARRTANAERERIILSLRLRQFSQVSNPPNGRFWARDGARRMTETRAQSGHSS